MRQNQYFALFGKDDPTAAMKCYIREHFGDLLGAHAALLDEPGGLEALQALIRNGELSSASRG